MRALFIILAMRIEFTYTSAEESCDAESGNCISETERSRYSGKWKEYYAKIQTAEESYVECSATNCECFDKKLEDDLAPFKSSGITKDLFNSAKAAVPRGNHYQIIGHRLFRSKECMFGPRCKGIEHFMLELLDELPDMELILNERDYPQIHKLARKGTLPVFSFSKTPDYWDVEYPAWSFWSGGPAIGLHPTGIGRWDLLRDSIHSAGLRRPWEDKVQLHPQLLWGRGRVQEDLAFFRGSRTSAERDPLVLLSRRAPGLVDAAYTKNQAWKSDKDTLGQPAAAEVSFEDHCKYKYLFNFRGVAASFRLKHLFLCGSLVVHVGGDYDEFFYDALKPWIHYVPLDADLAGLEETLEFLRENDVEAAKIARRGTEFIWGHLRQDDVSCYWRKLLKSYAGLMRYKVKRDPTLISIKAS